MIEVTCTRFVRGSPAHIFEILADPTNLARMLPRVRRIDVLEQFDDHARIATHMAFGPFGTVRNEGEARWRDGSEISFISRTPIFVETRWQIVPANAGATVNVILRLDLAPLIGPLAGFIPPRQVVEMVAPELEAALAALATQVEAASADNPHPASL
ncbi:MAG: SRPBCC family protein [Roseiflexaceae bacterium]|nr:SRPBCC family protein [Roseiflexaceae bacterium]